MDPALLIALSFPALLFFAYFALTWHAKQMVWPLGTPGDRHYIHDIDGYAGAMVREAVQLGFEFLGWSDESLQIEYPRTRGILVSPDRATIAAIGTGTRNAANPRCVWLFSVDKHFRQVCVTIDNPDRPEFDLSGHWLVRRVLAAQFRTVWIAHQRRTSKVLPGGANVFSPGDEFRSLESMFRLRISAGVERGLMKYVDPDANWWKFTLLGAVLASVASLLCMLRARLWPYIVFR